MVKYSDYTKKTDEIISMIDLNYMLALARKERHTLRLVRGSYINDDIVWSKKANVLSHNYRMACTQIRDFIADNNDKIIKINTTSNSNYPINRNTIIYIPLEYDIDNLNRELRRSCISVR